MVLKVLLLIVGVVSTNPLIPLWKINTSYFYEINSHSLTILKGYSSGIIFKGKLHITVRNNGGIFGEIVDLKYGQWTSDLTSESLNSLMANKVFEIEMKNGVINDVIVEKNTYNWEANIIKAILSQLQINTNAENVVNDTINSLSEDNVGIFKVMEETVTGKMETLYNIRRGGPIIHFDNRIEPRIHYQTEIPVFVPIRALEIVKHKNYNNVKENIQYHYGLPEDEFIKRSSFGRAIIDQYNFETYTLQNSYTVNEVFVKPTLADTENIKMESVMNLTLIAYKNGTDITFSDETIALGGLSYTYNSPYSTNLVRNEKNRKQNKPILVNEADVPFLPFNVGFKGNSLKLNENFNITQNVELLLNHLRKSDTQENSAEMFLHLTSLLKLMNFDELERILDKYYINNVFLDALSHSGTGPAFLILEKLILWRKVPMFQASLLLSTFTSNVREPTEELVEVYFRFVQKKIIQEQLLLNQTALLSFTNFLRNVYINDKISKEKYPAHTFGKFNTINGRLFVINKVLPYLNDNLNKFIMERNSKKAHLYIRAIGNIGHPEILKMFEPYLEGGKFATQFQRLWMVLSLDKLIETYPIIAQSVFYRIYVNIEEIEEIRVAAINSLMKTYPSLEMLQRIAEYTNIDQNEQVNAAVKASFESIASLKDEQFSSFRLSVEKAKVFLNKSINPRYTGRHFIFNKLFNFNKFLNNLPFELNSFNFERFIHGFTHLTSSFKKNEEKLRNNKGKPFEPFYCQCGGQIEGLLNFKIGDYNTIFSFDDYTVSSIPEVIQAIEKHFQPNIEINKWINSRQITIGFPTETGLPCSYTYDTPINYHLNGNFNLEFKPKLSDGKQIYGPSEIIGNLGYLMSFKMKTIGKLNILTPFDSHIYSSTYEKYSQIYLPFKTNFLFNLKDDYFKVEIIPNEELLNKVPLFHFNTKAFVSNSSIIPQKSNSKLIINRLNQFEKHFDKKVDRMAFKLSVIQDGKPIKDLFSNDILYRNVSVYFDGKKSDNKIIIIKFRYKNVYKTEPTNAHNILKYFQKNYLNLIKNDLNYHNMNIGIYDLFIQFKGKHNINHILKFVCGKSNIDPKSLVLIEYLKKLKKNDSLLNRLIIHANNYIPNTNEIDFNYTVHNSPIIYSNLQLFYGVKEYLNNIQADIKLERSIDRKNDLLTQSFVRKCIKNISLTPQCTELMEKMNFFDKLTIDIGFNNVTDEFKLALEDFYNFYDSLYFFNMNIDKIKLGNNNKVGFKVLLNPDLSSLKVNVETEDVQLERNYVIIGDFVKELNLIHPPICGFDNKQITKFNKKSSLFTLTNGWRVLFNYVPVHLENYEILIRKNSDLLHTDVKLKITTPKTENTVEINLIPEFTKNNLTIITAQLINDNIAKNFTNKTLDFNNGHIQIYTLPNNEYKTLIDNVFYLIYDGFNVKLSLLNNNYGILENRNSLCWDRDESVYNIYSPVPDIARNYEYISNNDWQISANSNDCIHYKRHYIEQENHRICFLIHPIPYLSCTCEHVEYVYEYFPAHCTNLTQTTILWKHYIVHGGGPDFSHLNITDNISIEVPKSLEACI